MLTKLKCFLGFHEYELKKVIVFLDTDMMNVCKHCGRWQYPMRHIKVKSHGGK